MNTTLKRNAKGALASALIGAFLVLAGSNAAYGHSQTVTPPSKDVPVVTGPISKPYAQAHCNSNAPATVAEASNGVVVFTPAGALPCPPIPNPGGQVHP
jgi:hypothetical protein